LHFFITVLHLFWKQIACVKITVMEKAKFTVVHLYCVHIKK